MVVMVPVPTPASPSLHKSPLPIGSGIWLMPLGPHSLVPHLVAPGKRPGLNPGPPHPNPPWTAARTRWRPTRPRPTHPGPRHPGGVQLRRPTRRRPSAHPGAGNLRLRSVSQAMRPPTPVKGREHPPAAGPMLPCGPDQARRRDGTQSRRDRNQRSGLVQPRGHRRPGHAPGHATTPPRRDHRASPGPHRLTECRSADERAHNPARATV